MYCIYKSFEVIQAYQVSEDFITRSYLFYGTIDLIRSFLSISMYILLFTFLFLYNCVAVLIK